MKRLRIRMVLIFMLGVLAGSFLLRISQDVQEVEDNVFALQKNIEKEQEAIRVLKAEWEYLNSPLRLEALAGDYLPELMAPEPDQMMARPAAALPDILDAQILKPQNVRFSSDVCYRVAPAAERQRCLNGGGLEKEVVCGADSTNSGCPYVAGHDNKVVVRPKSKPQSIGLKKKPEKDFQDLLNALEQGARP